METVFLDIFLLLIVYKSANVHIKAKEPRIKNSSWKNLFKFFIFPEIIVKAEVESFDSLTFKGRNKDSIVHVH